MECNQPAGTHVDEAETAPVRSYLPIEDHPCYGSLGTALMLELLTELTRFPVGRLMGRPVKWTIPISFKTVRNV